MKNNILLAIACGEYIKTRTAFCLFNLKTDATIIMQMGCDVAHNRNNLAQMALDGNYSHILFIDTDMIFAPDTLQRMLAHDKDIIACAYNKRRFPLESVVSPLDTSKVNHSLPSELFKAHSAGLGMMLIKVDVLTKMAYPFFDFTYRDTKRIGEDVYFCEKARELGYDVWIDPTIPVNHLGEYQY